MKAKKGNRVYIIDNDIQKSCYQKQGFDIYDDDGNIIEHGAGKTVPYADFLSLKAENEKLKSERQGKSK